MFSHLTKFKMQRQSVTVTFSGSFLAFDFQNKKMILKITWYENVLWISFAGMVFIYGIKYQIFSPNRILIFRLIKSIPNCPLWFLLELR